MESRRIPQPNISQQSEIIRQRFLPSEEGITFSFEAIETNEFFNLDSTCVNWSSELFIMLKNVSKIQKKHLISGAYKTYRVHSHESATPPCPLPENVSQKDLFQIRISKSKGGIHGVFTDNIFYVIWFDPLHNMYPSSTHGGLRRITPPTTCCMDRDNHLEQLVAENAQLKDDNAYWEAEWDKIFKS